MSGRLPLVRLPPGATIHRFGTPSTSAASAILRFPKDGWTIPHGPSAGRGAWAIVGDGEGRRLVVETLLSRHRIHPPSPPPGPFPYPSSLLSTSPDSSVQITKPIRHLAFARPPTTGEFTDFTARYGALQDEDRLSFRQTLTSLVPPPTPSEIDSVAGTMQISHLLDLPGVSLSSGQTRRARIASALLTKPVLLILEDPMAGLDVKSRKEVSDILGRLNEEGDIRVALVLRGKAESMPDWITDICDVRGGEVWLGSRREWEKRRVPESSTSTDAEAATIEEMRETEARETEPVVMLEDVSVSYGEGTRQVLKGVSWSIRPGDKWHLQGANGSGKTTLLSLILGHHPRSYSLPASSMSLFSKPRRATPTAILKTKIGHTSPEIYASFPRGMVLTAAESVGTGFEGIFSRRNLSPAQTERVEDLLRFFAPYLANGTNDTPDIETIGKRAFAHFTPPQQALLLFLRAIVSRPPLLILDEPSQGMDEVIWDRCRQFLGEEWEANPDQAVIVVSHYDDEVPWIPSKGRVFKLEEGLGTVC